MEIRNVKGCYDFLPKEQKIKNYITGVLKDTFEKFGYNSIETPILCYYDMLSDKYDEDNDILNEIYKLRDQGNRTLGLRYDLTVPFAKFIALNKNKICMPFKRYEINKVFRDGPIKVGRDREFIQCDVDVVGIKGQYIEAELLSLYKEIFDKFGIDIYIKYNSRNLMNGIIAESGIDASLLQNTTTIIDKKDKITKNEFKNELLKLDINIESVDKLIKYLNLDLKQLSIEFQNSKNKYIVDGINEITNLNKYIKDLKLENICIFDSSLARGQNYYTGNIFEVYDKTQRVKSSIGGGGRYDKMITNFINDGNEYPAVGISFGLSSLYEILKDDEDLIKNSYVDIFMIPLGTEIESLRLANKLRNMGFSVDIDMTGKKLRKSMEFANKENIKYVIILGENEIKNNVFNIKNMYTNDSRMIQFNSFKKDDIVF